MGASDDAGGLNLTGAWQGVYSYPRPRDPVPFSAMLTETDSRLYGTTEEVGHAGTANGMTLVATLDGRRNGRAVTWLKLYDGRHRFYDTVHYVGELNADGTEIHGSWIVPGSWSGTFLMIRSAGSVKARVKEMAERA